jgi:hypothetical protein
MNPSPFGAFAEGIAGGITGGMENYVKLAMAKIDQQQKEALARSKSNQDLFSNTNLPLSIRKKAWKEWAQTNKDWQTGIDAPELPDEMWEDKRLTNYFKKAIKIRDNKNYSISDQIKFTRALIAEAGSELGKNAADSLKPVLKGMQTESFALGTGALGKGKLTPEIRQQLAASESGQKVLIGRAKEVHPKAPTPAMYETKSVGKGMSQKFKWNPETQKHDIAYGKPRLFKGPTYQRIGSTIYEIKGGKSKALQRGSIRERATVNAMQEKSWQWMDEVAQFDAIEKHERLIKGEPGPVSPSAQPEEPEPAGFFKSLGDKYFPRQTQALKGGAPEMHTVKRDYGASEHPEGATATNAQGVTIITKKGRWVKK